MSAFGAKADVEWCCEESPLMTQSGHNSHLPAPTREPQKWRCIPWPAKLVARPNDCWSRRPMRSTHRCLVRKLTGALVLRLKRSSENAGNGRRCFGLLFATASARFLKNAQRRHFFVRLTTVGFSRGPSHRLRRIPSCRCFRHCWYRPAQSSRCKERRLPVLAYRHLALPCSKPRCTGQASELPRVDRLSSYSVGLWHN